MAFTLTLSMTIYRQPMLAYLPWGLLKCTPSNSGRAGWSLLSCVLTRHHTQLLTAWHPVNSPDKKRTPLSRKDRSVTPPGRQLTFRIALIWHKGTHPLFLLYRRELGHALMLFLSMAFKAPSLCSCGWSMEVTNVLLVISQWVLHKCLQSHFQ